MNCNWMKIKESSSILGLRSKTLASMHLFDNLQEVLEFPSPEFLPEIFKSRPIEYKFSATK